MNGKIRDIVLFVSAVPMLFSCAGEPKTTPNKDKAKGMFQRVQELYRIPKYGLFSGCYSDSRRPDLTYFSGSTRQAQGVSYPQPMSSVFPSAILMTAIELEKYTVYIGSMVMAVKHYYDTTRVPFGYQAYPVQFGRVDRYYDNSGLVDIDYIDSYLATKNPHYLERTKQVLTFILSGWDENLEGTVSWLEGVKDQEPTCSNGKAMVLALKLYEATRDNHCLEVGKKFYHWINKYLKDPERGVVWNSQLTTTSAVCPDLYTYNTGTLLQTAVALYNHTGEQAYSDNTRFLTERSYRVFFEYTEEGTPYIADLPWFNLVLFRGHHSLYSVTGGPKYVDTMIRGLDYAWGHARDQVRLMYHDWTGRTGEKRRPKWPLDASCVPKYYARVAMVKGEVKTEK